MYYFLPKNNYGSTSFSVHTNENKIHLLNIASLFNSFTFLVENTVQKVY